MKTVGKRMSHLRENVLKITLERMKELTGVSRTPLNQIESNENAPRALEKVIEALQLNPLWVHEGKGEIFASGTEAENVARIKAGTKPADASPYRDELIVELKRRAEAAEADKIKLQSWLDRILNGNVNFLKPLDRKAPYAQGA